MLSNLLPLPTVGLLLAFSGAAAAQTQPTPEQAHALEGQITTWLKTITPAGETMTTRPVELTPEGDHYLVRVPIGVAGRIEPVDAAFTGKARQLDGTRWALDDQHFPPEMTFHSSERVPDPPDAKNPSADGMHKEDVIYRVKLGDQDVHGVFDTSLATPTTSGGSLASLDLQKEGGSAPAVTHVGLSTTQTSTRPVDAGHSDLLSDVTSADYATRTELPDGTTVAIDAKRLHVVTAISALSHGQVVPLVRLLGELGQFAKAPGGTGSDGPSPAEMAKMRALLVQARNIMTGAKMDQTLEGVTFAFGGTSGKIGKAEIDIGGDAPGDTLSMTMGIGMDGLVLDTLPPALAAYVPTHFAIRPTVSNVSVGALTKMGMDATAPLAAGETMPEPDVMSLFANGGITFGFDSLALDVAGAQITGTGKFTSKTPQSVTGQAELSARGLDALVSKAQSDPMLQQAVPVIIFLKGIARTTGDQAVWQITVNNAKVLVNGVDLSALAGGTNK